MQQETDEAITTESTYPVPFDAQLPLPLPTSRWQDYSSSTSHTRGLGDYLPLPHDPPSNAHLSRLSISDALGPSGKSQNTKYLTHCRLLTMASIRTAGHQSFQLAASRSSEGISHGGTARQDRLYPSRQSSDATLALQRTKSMPSTLSDFPSLCELRCL
jgi:hypothetical protein